MERISRDSAGEFRAAVFLAWNDALALRDLLDRNIKPVEKEIRAAIAEQKKLDEEQQKKQQQNSADVKNT
jgi:hypothetical protein